MKYDSEFINITKKELSRREAFWNKTMMISVGFLITSFLFLSYLFTIFLSIITAVLFWIYRNGSLNYTHKIVRNRFEAIKRDQKISNENVILKTLEYRANYSKQLRATIGGFDPFLEYLHDFKKTNFMVFEHDEILVYITALFVWQRENNLILDDDWTQFYNKQIEMIKAYYFDTKKDFKN